MKVEICINDGSPIGVTSKTVWGDSQRIGLGGAELALITLCEAWQARGDQVILYNNPWEPNASPFEQRAITDFHPSDPHEIVIFFRSPPTRNPVFLGTHGLKCWLSCDQQSVGDYKSFSRNMDRIVVISDFHQRYFMERYGIANAMVIDLPVRFQDFENLSQEKVPQRVIFTSVPARGLDNLLRLWPRILAQVPEATLVITSDYRLWGVEASNEHFRRKWMYQNNVSYYGAMKRDAYLRELAQAELFLYPSNYDELFCIACSEAQALGAFPITSSTGALPTTNMGCLVDGSGDNAHNDSVYVERAVAYLRNENKIEMQTIVKDKAKDRFNLDTILQQWDENVFK